MSFPLNKLIDLSNGRYIAARAAMKMVSDIANNNNNRIDEIGEKLAIHCLRKVLNNEIAIDNIKIGDNYYSFNMKELIPKEK